MKTEGLDEAVQHAKETLGVFRDMAFPQPHMVKRALLARAVLHLKARVEAAEAVIDAGNCSEWAHSKYNCTRCQELEAWRKAKGEGV